MFKHRSIFFLCIFFLILAAIAGVSSASAAASDDGARVSLSITRSRHQSGQPVVVQVTVSNPTSHPVKVLKWFTPADDVEESLFIVSLNNATVAYVGPVYKRPAITGKDYLVLTPGEKLVKTVDLTKYYDFSTSGDYSIRYNVSSYQLFSAQGSGFFNPPAQLSSNVLKLWASGRPQIETNRIVPDAVTGTTSFNKCTTTQQADSLTARAQASVYSTDALSYLQSGKTGSRFSTWFGTYLASRYTTVTTHYGAIKDAMDTKPVTIDCGCKKNYYAYVYPTKPYIIYVCKVFWTAPMAGTDSKAGTLIHEMSHFNVVASTNDYVYGQTGAMNLAISDPVKAIANADNHEYFAENNPALP